MQAAEAARLDREKRRRKIMAEQVKAQANIEEERYQTILLEKVLRESRRERAAAQELYRLNQYQEVIRLNRELRQRVYEEQQKASFTLALERDKEMLLEAKADNEERIREELKFSRKIQRDHRAAKRCITANKCEKVFDMILDLVEAAHRECEANNWTKLPDERWRELLAGFSKGRKPLCLEEAAAAANAAAAELAAEDMALAMKPEAQVARGASRNSALWQFLRESASSYRKGEGVFTVPLSFNSENVFNEILNDSQLPNSLNEQLTSCIKISENGIPAVEWIGAVIRGLLRRCEPPREISTGFANELPKVPLRLILTGKPLSGKRTLVRRLSSVFGLHIIDVDVAIKRALKFAGRLPASDADDALLLVEAAPSVHKGARKEKPKVGTNIKNSSGEEETASPEIKAAEEALKEWGLEADEILTSGEEISDALYAKLIRLEIIYKFAVVPRPEAVSENASNSPSKKKNNAASPEDLEKEALRASNAFGWVILGFPQTLGQYRALELELSGFVDPILRPSPNWVVEFENDQITDALVSAPVYNSPPPVEEIGAANVHIRLETPIEEVVRRSVGRRWDPQLNCEVKLEDFDVNRAREPFSFERLVDLDMPSDSGSTVAHRAAIFDELQAEVDAFAANFIRPANPEHESLNNQVSSRLVAVGSNTAVSNLDEMFAAACAHVDSVLAAEVALVKVKEQAEEDAKAAAKAQLELEEENQRKLEDFPSDDEETAAPVQNHAHASAVEDAAAETVVQTSNAKLSESDIEDLILKSDSEICHGLLSVWRGIRKNQLEQTAAALLIDTQLRAESSRGLVKFQEEIVALLECPDGRSAHVDVFITETNRLLEHYSDLVAESGECRAELHQRLAELSDSLFKITDDKRAKALDRLSTIMKSGWVEARLLELATALQYFASSEVNKLWSIDQLLQDVGYCLAGLGFTNPSNSNNNSAGFEPPVFPDVVGNEVSAQETPSGLPVQGCHQNFGRIRVWDGEGPPPAERGDACELPTVGLWSFPFVHSIFYEAMRLTPPITAPTDPFAPAPQVDAKGKPVVDPKASHSNTLSHPALTAMVQARIELRTQFICNMNRVKEWAARRALEFVTACDKTFNTADNWITARVIAESEASEELQNKLASLIEEGKPVLHHMKLSGIQLHEIPNDVIVNVPTELKLPAMFTLPTHEE